MDNRFLVRPMDFEDLEQVVELEREAFTEPWSMSTFVYEITKNSLASYLVVTDQEDEGKIAGYVGMWLISGEAHITNVAVFSSYRGKGLGEALMMQQIAQSRLLGAERMTLEARVSNQVAINLYKKLGFREAGIRKKYYEDNGEDALIMWKEYQSQEDGEDA